ncbi:MAG: hydroxymethylglutaryl-CoA reductase, degradative, partial [Gammaproteobacteria bacterium]
MSDSRIANFYRLGHAGRVRELAERGLISTSDAETLLSNNPLLAVDAADRMIENVIGVFGLPLAVAPNFLVNGKNYIVPMVVEEPSIVAGVSSAAKLARASGGFIVTSTDPILIGQMQIVDAGDPDTVIQSIDGSRDELLALANELQPGLKQRGGGARDIECFKLRLPDGRWAVVLHLLVDTRDAMGANAVNTMCEGLARHIERISGGKVCLKIISNLTDRALIDVSVTFPVSILGQGDFSGEHIRDGIVLANDFASVDPYRAATHNKGIMNGIDAVAVATGNDWRSVEAGAHAYAARDGQYRALTKWSAASNGALLGKLVMPIKVGVVGGSQSSNPSAATGLRIAGTDSATELAELMGAVGLAQNFAALRALVSDGIQKGHMSLHARSVAAAAGVPDEIFDQVVAGMIDSGEVKQWKARELSDKLIDELRPREDGATPVLTNDVSTSAVAEGVAAGKVILLGEHAAVYDKHVLALPLESGVI